MITENFIPGFYSTDFWILHLILVAYRPSQKVRANSRWWGYMASILVFCILNNNLHKSLKRWWNFLSFLQFNIYFILNILNSNTHKQSLFCKHLSILCISKENESMKKWWIHCKHFKSYIFHLNVWLNALQDSIPESWFCTDR